MTRRGMVPPMRSLASFALVLLVGCQDYETGVQTLCNAPRDCVGCVDAAPDQRSRVMAEHITRSVRNGEVVEMFEAMANMPLDERAPLLRKAAEKAGLSRCILAEQFEQEAKDAAVPAPSDSTQ